ncbi:MAG: NAD(P)/FAD-dependent oxidoreductase [Roseobacter sp.]
MTEVTIRGAGIFGLSIAWECVCRGARVRVIDPHGVAAGSSGGIVGALAPHVPENWNPKKAFQFESLLMAQGFWGAVEDASGMPSGYARSGRLQPVPDDAALDLAAQRAANAVTLWQGKATWELVRTGKEPWAPNSPSGWLIKDTLSAHLHPRKACEALATALKVKGVTIEKDGPNRGAVVWATGVAGLEALNTGRSRSVGAGIKGQAALLSYDMRGAPQLFADTVHIIPHFDGTVAVGSTSERVFDAPDTTDAQLDLVLEKARAAVPALRIAPCLATWAGVRPRARSRAPMLGRWPDRPNHFIANGGFKIGFGMAPKVAQVMADLVLDGADTIPTGFEVAASL